MKKSYLMIAAAAALFAACAQNDTFREINNTEGPAISFSTYAQKTTRAENSDSTYRLNLKDHHLTFKVWGYKNTETNAVFDGDSVGYSNSKWSYLFKRYWDKTATTYEFYAFAPENAPFTFDGVSSIATQKDGYFKITSAYSKTGANRSPMTEGTPVAVWNDFNDATDEDVDLMIADTCRLSGPALIAAQGDKVSLNFIHILSRLNITLKTTTEGLDKTVATDDSLCVDSIIITNFAHAGTFDETQGNVTANELQAGTTDRWTPTDIDEYKYEIDYTVTTDKTYAIEALLIPQEIVKDTINLDGSFPAGADVDAPYIKISYSIYSYNPQDGTKAANKEHFTAYYNLAKVFGVATNGDKLAFNEGWQNTLNITISPAIIQFDANVAPWADKTTEEVTVY